MKLHYITLILLFFITGCATPPEVKTLSVKQIEYFDVAIDAAEKQSQSLILATEIIVNNAKERIKSIEETSKAEAQNFLLTVIPSLPEDTRKEAIEGFLIETRKNIESEQRAKAKLEKDLEDIKAKSNQLIAYLGKMKDVHKAIDAYVQSEKAGEQLINDVLKLPSVNELLSKANEYQEKITTYNSELNLILNGLEKEKENE